MKRLILIMLIIICSVAALPVSRHAYSRYQQWALSASDEEITALAKYVDQTLDDPFILPRFVVIRSFSEGLVTGDTITVAHDIIEGGRPDDEDTVFLTANRSNGQKDYFLCRDHSVAESMRKVKMEKISFKEWEACERGDSTCKPLTFTRCGANEKWFLKLPCGGTETAIGIRGDITAYELDLHLYSDQCPPIIELSNMPDGGYHGSMRACGLGGTIAFNLRTE